jgi:hypothetical protein
MLHVVMPLMILMFIPFLPMSLLTKLKVLTSLCNSNVHQSFGLRAFDVGDLKLVYFNGAQSMYNSSLYSHVAVWWPFEGFAV